VVSRRCVPRPRTSASKNLRTVERPGSGDRRADDLCSSQRGALAIPGPHLGAVEEKLTVIVRANQKMEKFHRERAAATPTA